MTTEKTRYSVTIDSDGQGSVVIVEGGRSKVFTHLDPNFPHIVAAAHRGLPLDDALVYRIPRDIERLSERAVVEDDRLFFDNRPVEGEIATIAMRYHEEGRDMLPIIRFMERLSENTSARSREQLFMWLQKQNLEITPDGMVIGYRGLDADMHSHHSGGANVLTQEDRDKGVEEPGEWVKGRVPNFLGSIISMPREMVDDDPNRDCSNGLHIGSETYARGWADKSTTIVVQFDPADVVAVPPRDTDKVRVCRYEILGHIDGDDHETEADPDAANAASEADEEATAAALEEAIPAEFRSKMKFTERIGNRLRRNKEES